MTPQDHESEPHELVQALREKLAKAKLTKDQIEKLIPPSLTKRDHCNLPPYEPGSYRKQCEEYRKRLEKLENQCLPGFAPKKVQDKYLNEFYELKAQGKVSHLSPEMLEKLEKELKASAANVNKHAELEEFLSSLNEQAAIPEYQQPADIHDANLPGNNRVKSQEDDGENREKKKSITVRAHDGSLVECVVIFGPSSLCEASLTLIESVTEKREPREIKGPIKVASRTAHEVLDALNMVTEYIQHNDLENYLEDLKLLEKTLRQKV